MKNAFIILFVLLVLTFGGIIFYKNYYGNRPDPWKFVPENAILVYETNAFTKSWNALTLSPIWKSIGQFPYFNKTNQVLIDIDSLSGKNGAISSAIDNTPVLVSLHATAADQADALFVLSPKNTSSFQKMVNTYIAGQKYSSRERTYLNLSIQDIFKKDGSSVFSYLIHKGIFIGSENPILVEDVSRMIEEGFERSFQDKISDLASLTKLENDEGNLYIHNPSVSKGISIFLKPEYQHFNYLDHFVNNTFFDLKVSGNELLLNGLSSVNGNLTTFSSTLLDQGSKQIRAVNLMPERTAWMRHYAFTDFRSWQNKMVRFRSNMRDKYLNEYIDLDNTYDLSLDWIKEEIALAHLENLDSDAKDNLLVLETNNIDDAIASLNKLTRQLKKDPEDTVYFEVFAEDTIQQLDHPDFPAIVFGEVFEGFESVYYTPFKDYVVIGSTIEVIKNFKEDVENDRNWGKQIDQSIFLESTLGEANFSFFVNTDKVWNKVQKMLLPKWQLAMEEQQNNLKSFDKIAFQVSNLDNRFFTSLSMHHNPSTQPARSGTRFTVASGTYTFSPIITKPYIVKNHNTKESEIFVQDSLHIAYLISPKGEVLWADSIGSAIATKVYQVDFYRNGKLQLLFATKDHLFLVDRNGNDVENYPIQLPETLNSRFLSLIDYDNSKKYRFMLSDEQGDLYLYDKKGNLLEGWNPLTLGGALAAAPTHVRIKSRDCMVAISQSGTINVLNRRGKSYAGFPINLNAEIKGEYFVKKGDSFSTSAIITVTKNGELIELDFNGKMKKREQLYVPSTETSFWLIKDPSGNKYVYARQDYNRITILDRQGKERFEKNFISSGDLSVQYYYFDRDNELFMVNDLDQEFTFILNALGEIVNFEPVESSAQVAVIYYSKQKQYHLFKSFKNSIQELTIDR